MCFAFSRFVGGGGGTLVSHALSAEEAGAFHVFSQIVAVGQESKSHNRLTGAE